MDDDDRRDLGLAAFLILFATVALAIEGEFDWSNLTPFLIPFPAAVILGYVLSVALIVRVVRRNDNRRE